MAASAAVTAEPQRCNALLRRAGVSPARRFFVPAHRLRRCHWGHREWLRRLSRVAFAAFARDGERGLLHLPSIVFDSAASLSDNLRAPRPIARRAFYRLEPTSGFTLFIPKAAFSADRLPVPSEGACFDPLRGSWWLFLPMASPLVLLMSSLR